MFVRVLGCALILGTVLSSAGCVKRANYEPKPFAEALGDADEAKWDLPTAPPSIGRKPVSKGKNIVRAGAVKSLPLACTTMTIGLPRQWEGRRMKTPQGDEGWEFWPNRTRKPVEGGVGIIGKTAGAPVFPSESEARDLGRKMFGQSAAVNRLRSSMWLITGDLIGHRQWLVIVDTEKSAGTQAVVAWYVPAGKITAPEAKADIATIDKAIRKATFTGKGSCA